MKKTEQTLLEQMKIGELEVTQRQALFSLSDEDAQLLQSIKPIIDHHIDQLVEQFYQLQTSIPEIALLIGDADTLSRLSHAQHKYILDLFSGFYDLEYVNNRLRIGLVHKRIGVEPKLYLSAVYSLRLLLNQLLASEIEEPQRLANAQEALEKLLMFDVSLVFDTYIRSMLTEIEIAKEKSDLYAESLESKVKERTRQLEEISRTDPLTGLLNVRYLSETLTTTLRAAQRRSEPVSVVFIDLNDFKQINDLEGHQRGDEILCVVGHCIADNSRQEDSCFRYGGDEFCIILPNCNEEAAIQIYRERLKAEISEKLDGIGLSIGIIQTGPNEYLETDQLLRQVDQKMYEEKKRIKSLA